MTAPETIIQHLPKHVEKDSVEFGKSVRLGRIECSCGKWNSLWHNLALRAGLPERSAFIRHAQAELNPTPEPSPVPSGRVIFSAPDGSMCCDCGCPADITERRGHGCETRYFCNACAQDRWDDGDDREEASEEGTDEPPNPGSDGLTDGG